MNEERTAKRMVAEMRSLTAAWLMGVMLYKCITRSASDTRPLTPIEWTSSVAVLAGIWLGMTMLRNRRTRTSATRNGN